MSPVFNIEKETIANENYRNIIYTGENMQLVYMSLLPGESIPMEMHSDVDQFFRIEAGTGQFTVGNDITVVKDGWSVIVPAGTPHLVENVSKTEKLKLYTIYAPPEHDRGKCNIRQPVKETKGKKDFYGW